MAVLKEIDWATSYCPLSWEAQGAWPGCGKGLGEGIAPAALPGKQLNFVAFTSVRSVFSCVVVVPSGGPLDKGFAPSRVSALDTRKYADRFLEVRGCARSASGDTIAAVDEYGRMRLSRCGEAVLQLQLCVFMGLTLWSVCLFGSQVPVDQR